VSGELNVFLLHAQPLAESNAQLFLDEVDAAHQLRHGMLDLNARVHLHEVELAGRSDEKLDGARVLVAHGFGAAHSGIAQRFARFLRMKMQGDSSSIFW
jgi:hypothetical protein